MTNRLGNSLAFLGGGDREILDLVPRERSRFAAMGAILLTTAGLAAVSFFFALRNGVQLPLIPSVIGCLVWGFIILNLDRFLVVSMGYTRSGSRLILMSLPRLILSAVISLVTAAPLVVQIFSTNINMQLALTHAKQPDAPDRGLLAQLQALSALSSKDSAVETALVVTFLLFFLISILPVMAKILLSLGPPTAYEQVARYKEEEIVDAARARRIETRRREERQSAAQTVVEEDMRIREEALGKRANEHVAQHMEAILDVALAEWSRQVQSQLGVAEKSGQGSTGQIGNAAQQSGPVHVPSGLSTPTAQTKAGPGYQLPAFEDDDLL